MRGAGKITFWWNVGSAFLSHLKGSDDALDVFALSIKYEIRSLGIESNWGISEDSLWLKYNVSKFHLCTKFCKPFFKAIRITDIITIKVERWLSCMHRYGYVEKSIIYDFWITHFYPTKVFQYDFSIWLTYSVGFESILC